VGSVGRREPHLADWPVGEGERGRSRSPPSRARRSLEPRAEPGVRRPGGSSQLKPHWRGDAGTGVLVCGGAEAAGVAGGARIVESIGPVARVLDHCYIAGADAVLLRRSGRGWSSRLEPRPVTPPSFDCLLRLTRVSPPLRATPGLSLLLCVRYPTFCIYFAIGAGPLLICPSLPWLLCVSRCVCYSFPVFWLRLSLCWFSNVDSSTPCLVVLRGTPCDQPSGSSPAPGRAAT
jgi:hypothetical protein